jgi:hypothetical protein
MASRDASKRLVDCFLVVWSTTNCSAVDSSIIGANRSAAALIRMHASLVATDVSDEFALSREQPVLVEAEGRVEARLRLRRELDVERDRARWSGAAEIRAMSRLLEVVAIHPLEGAELLACEFRSSRGPGSERPRSMYQAATQAQALLCAHQVGAGASRRCHRLQPTRGRRGG